MIYLYSFLGIIGMLLLALYLHLILLKWIANGWVVGKKRWGNSFISHCFAIELPLNSMDDLMEYLEGQRMRVLTNGNTLVAFSAFYTTYPIIIKAVAHSNRADIEIRDAHLQLIISKYQKNKYCANDQLMSSKFPKKGVTHHNRVFARKPTGGVTYDNKTKPEKIRHVKADPVFR